MKNKLLLIGLLLGLTTVAYAQTKQWDKYFKAAADSGFSGVACIYKKGKEPYFLHAGFRHFETKEPLQVTDIFELASVSKQFTAMIIMQLKEQGKLQYDDLITQYINLPYQGISIRQLLHHTSGLPDYQAMMDQHWDKSKVAGNNEVIAYLNKYQPPIRFAPGEKYEYSNTGYLLLASIAEKVTNKDFVQLLQDQIFEPLGMVDTDVRTLADKKANYRIAAGHQLNFLKQYVNANVFHSADYTVWLGNRKGPGRISSTAQDLLLWDQALYTGKLVSPATLKEAFSPAVLNNGTLSQYGFGWDLEQDPILGKVVSHDGDNPGYSTKIIRYIDKHYTIIVLCNNQHPTHQSLINNLYKSLK